MRRRQFIAAVTAASATLVAGCGGSDAGPGEPEGEVGATVAITADGYDPLTVSVATGEAVEWTNETDEDRTVNANAAADGAREWELDLTIPAGETGAHTFRESGVYAYHDEEMTRFNMCGAIAVGDADDDVSGLPCE